MKLGLPTFRKHSNSRSTSSQVRADPGGFHVCCRPTPKGNVRPLCRSIRLPRRRAVICRREARLRLQSRRSGVGDFLRKGKDNPVSVTVHVEFIEAVSRARRNRPMCLGPLLRADNTEAARARVADLGEPEFSVLVLIVGNDVTGADDDLPGGRVHQTADPLKSPPQSISRTLGFKLRTADDRCGFAFRNGASHMARSLPIH